MAKGKWIFGNQSQAAAPVVVKPITLPPVVTPSDGKKIGLENFGNTCYANSVIQALYFTGPFRELLLQANDLGLVQHTDASTSSPLLAPRKADAPTDAPETSTTSANGLTVPTASNPATLFSALRTLFITISTHPSEKDKVAPRAFIDKLKEFNDVFRGTMHQDAHEFQNYLLNKMIDEVDEERKLVAANTTTEDLSSSIPTLGSLPPSFTSPSSSQSTLVHKLFEGVLTSETRCMTCETVSSRDEPFLDLSIDIEENSSVTACLRQFSASEMLCQRNKFFCDACCDLQEAEKRMKIKKLPNVLALHLKRFKYQEDVQKYVKLAYRVAFPFELRLFNTVDEAEDADRLYDLYGIVVHIGTGPHHGHYISIIKSLGTWLVYDDDNVYPIPEADISKYFGDSNAGTAYVLYYQATDIDSAALGIRTQEPIVNGIGSEPIQHSPVVVPVLPPGLATNEEGDSSDLSDPSYPVTPSPSSPLLLSTTDKALRSPPLQGHELDESPTTPIPAIHLKGSKNFFGLRSAPTANGRPSTAASTTASTVPSSTASSIPLVPESHETAKLDHADVHPHPSIVTSTEQLPPPLSEISHLRPRKDADKKASTSWFKRKSRTGEVSSPHTMLGGDLPASSPTTSSSNWFKVNKGEKKKHRSPSNGYLHEHSKNENGSSEHGHLSSREWKSTGTSSTSDLTPPDSAVSSPSNSHYPPEHSSSPALPLPSPSTPTPELPQRKGSMPLPELPRRAPDHKFSTSNLQPRKDKKRSSTRPATAHGDTGFADHHHPLPALPPTTTPLVPNRRSATLGKDELPTVSSSKAKPRTSSDRYDERQIPPPATPPPGLAFVASGASHTSSSTTASSNFKRATRKLSISSPLLGFGKKDKKHHENKDHSKNAPPSAFGQMSQVGNIS